MGMQKIKLPVVRKGQVVFPDKAVCPWCRKRKVYEPHSMAILNAGAMRQVGKGRYEMATENCHCIMRDSVGMIIDPQEAVLTLAEGRLSHHKLLAVVGRIFVVIPVWRQPGGCMGRKGLFKRDRIRERPV